MKLQKILKVSQNQTQDSSEDKLGIEKRPGEPRNGYKSQSSGEPERPESQRGQESQQNGYRSQSSGGEESQRGQRAQISPNFSPKRKWEGEK